MNVQRSLATLVLGCALTAPPLFAQTGPVPARVEVAPSDVQLGVGERITLSVRAFDAAGTVLGLPPRWVSADRDIVAITPEGEVVGIAVGTARVSALVNGAIGTSQVVVTAPAPARIEASLPVARIPLGASAPLSVRALDRSGQSVPAPGLTFASSDPGVARVDGEGRVFGVGAGQADITVSTGGARSTVSVTITGQRPQDASLEPASTDVRTGDVVRFRISSGGEALYPEWAVIGGGGAQVEADGPEGVFVAQDPGRYRVMAVVGPEIVRTATVEVGPREYEGQLITVGRGAIASHHSGDMWVFEGVDGRDYAYVGTYLHDWAKIWDVTDPGSPVLTDSLQLDARRINDVKIHPNARVGVLTREGASNRRNGIVILDLTDPAHPSILSEYTETVTGGVHNVWIVGELNLLYAAHNGTSAVHIIDISDPADPREVGRWGLDKPTKTLHDVIVQEGYAYLSYWDDGIITLDVGAGTHGGTPTEPTVVSQFKYPVGNSHVAWRQGRYLFIGDEIFPPGWDADAPIHARGYVHVIDFQDPENPTEVARYEVPEAGAHNLWAEGDRLYIGYYQAGLRVVDISGELRGDLYRQGREVAHIMTADGEAVTPNWPMTWGAQLHKGMIFSSDLNSGLWITRLLESGRVVFQ